MNHENEVEQLNIAICDDEENIRICIRKLIQKQETFWSFYDFIMIWKSERLQPLQKLVFLL